MILLQSMPQAPTALNDLVQQNVLVGGMAVLIFFLGWFGWNMLNRHFKTLEENGFLKDIIEEVKEKILEIYLKLK